MKLYRKSLNSLEELKREKIRLRYERMHTRSSDLNPLSELGKSKINRSTQSGIMSTIMELVSSGSPLDTAMAVGKPLLSLMRKRRNRAREIRYAAGLPPKRSLVRKVLTDVAVSYIIGKAVQMSVAGIGMYLHRKKAAKARKALYR